MKTYLEFKALVEDMTSPEPHGLTKLPFEKNPHIGWWQDHGDHYKMYHGTHERNLAGIAKHGIHAPKTGSTAGNVSMTHDPHTAHAYAAMSGSGGETGFRNAGQKATHTPHEHRAVLHVHIPKKWAHENMNHHLRGNMPETKDRLTDKSKYDQHKASGKPDHEYYQTTELRFKKSIPPEFIKGYSKKKDLSEGTLEEMGIEHLAHMAHHMADCCHHVAHAMSATDKSVAKEHAKHVAKLSQHLLRHLTRRKSRG